MCTLVVVLGYNFFTDQMVDIKSSKGIIVFAFIAGFYSSRLVALLDRMKEVILPANSTSVHNEGQTLSRVLLKDITIVLEVSTSMQPELRAEITDFGLSNAIVTIEDQQGGEVIEAQRVGEEQSPKFIFQQVRAGKYILKAVWTGTINEAPLTLQAQQLVELKHSGELFNMKLEQSPTNG